MNMFFYIILKAYLKHMDCECSKENANLVYLFLRRALDTLHYVVADSSSLYDYVSPLIYENSLFKSSSANISFMNAYRLFEVFNALFCQLIY